MGEERQRGRRSCSRSRGEAAAAAEMAAAEAAVAVVAGRRCMRDNAGLEMGRTVRAQKERVQTEPMALGRQL